MILGLIEDERTPGIGVDHELNIVFDNCGGQNKNNMVLRLVCYLVDMGFFSKVNFIFLVVGHTKNDADRFFNRLKKNYRKMNIYTMDMLCDVLCTSNKISIHRLDKEKDFKDYDTFLGSFYRKYPKIEEYTFRLF